MTRACAARPLASYLSPSSPVAPIHGPAARREVGGHGPVYLEPEEEGARARPVPTSRSGTGRASKTTGRQDLSITTTPARPSRSAGSQPRWSVKTVQGHIEPTISPTRTEQDFATHIRATVASDPEAAWIFVTDQLNTHKSESLVRLVAEICEIKDDLGKKGVCGVLHNMETRRAFLEDESHRVRFVYTPRHCSWLNQVEIWFSILVRRLLKRASFTSLDDQRARIEAFIKYFNEVLAKPFKWTYTGRLLET